MKIEIGKRIRAARKQAGLTLQELSDRTGKVLSASRLSNYEQGLREPDPQSLTLIAKALGTGITASQLLFGHDAGAQGGGREAANISPATEIRGRVPLISWIQAGLPSDVIDNFQPGDAMDWIATDAPVKKHTFALRVEGSSMEPEFMAGTIIVVEPDIDPQTNDFVVAKNCEEEATFKQLVKDGGEWFLKPLNPQFPIRPLGDYRIIGVVVAQTKRYR